jgi:hypothetical protein
MTIKIEILNPKAVQLIQSLIDLELIAVSGKDEIMLSESQKKMLDERRLTIAEEDYIPWEKAKKQLKVKSK